MAFRISKLIGIIKAVILAALKGDSGTAAVLQTLLTRILILATNVATGIITARFLGPAGRGEQAAMTLWPQFLAYTLTLGLPTALTYNFKRYPKDKAQLLAAAFILSIGLGLLASLVGITCIPYWLSKHSLEVIHFSQWLMLLAPIPLVTGVLSAALQAQDEFTVPNQVSFFPPLLTLIFLAALALTGGLTPFNSALAYLLPGTPFCGWIVFRAWQLCSPSWSKLGNSYYRLLSYGIRSYGIEMLGTLSNYVDQALVVSFLTPAELGTYVVALSLSRMLSVLQTSTITVLFPKVSDRPIPAIVALVGFATRVSTGISCLIAIALIVAGPLLLNLLYGQQFVEANAVFRILVLEALISGTTWLLAQAFMAAGRPGTVTVLQAIGFGTSVPLMVILIPTFGIEGAGFSLLISAIIRFICIFLSFPLFLKVRPPNLIITQHDLSNLIYKLRHR